MPQLKNLNEKVVNRVQKLFDNKYVRITQIVVASVAASLIVWDIYLYMYDTTISRAIRANATEENLFVITWIWGILSAHLFVSRKRSSQTVPEFIGIIIIILISLLLFLLGKFIDPNILLPQYMHVVLLAFGAISGYFLWPQKVED